MTNTTKKICINVDCMSYYGHPISGGYMWLLKSTTIA